MEKKPKITQYRERLDKTLASPDLTNVETLRTLVGEQLLRSSHKNEGCSDNLVDKRTMEVSNFLAMLRSASVNENEVSETCDEAHTAWKLKQENEEFRVMYREGPGGTPFHSLLAEGYVDGPLDACLCISWESALYKKWWPNYTVPAFKVVSCDCVQKIRLDEQISLVRVKLSWPLSTREAVVHYFEFEYFQDDLIVVTMNTIPNLESIDTSTHGFTKEGIPEAKDVVRIDFVGGFALQKVTPERSYFRTIANMDMKLDFVPPSLINFISRQLIGSGFRLYQKAVSSKFNFDEDLRNALADPLYSRIRKTLYSSHQPNSGLETKELENEMHTSAETHFIRSVHADLSEEIIGKLHKDDHGGEALLENEKVTDRNPSGKIVKEHSIQCVHADLSEEISGKVDVHEGEVLPEDTEVTDKDTFCEIEEERSENSRPREQAGEGKNESHGDITPDMNSRNVHISTDVQEALKILDKAIYMIREYGSNVLARPSSGLISEMPPKLEKVTVANSLFSNNAGITSNGMICAKAPEEANERTSLECWSSSGSHKCREVLNNKIAPASPGQNLRDHGEGDEVYLSYSRKDTVESPPILDHIMHEGKRGRTEVSDTNEDGGNEESALSQRRKHWLCCLHLIF